mgnify:FL=1
MQPPLDAAALELPALAQLELHISLADVHGLPEGLSEVSFLIRIPGSPPLKIPTDVISSQESWSGEAHLPIGPELLSDLLTMPVDIFMFEGPVGDENIPRGTASVHIARALGPVAAMEGVSSLSGPAGDTIKEELCFLPAGDALSPMQTDAKTPVGRASMTMRIEGTENLLEDKDTAQGRILTVRLLSAHSLPPKCLPGDAAGDSPPDGEPDPVFEALDYKAVLQVPFSESREQRFVLPKGRLQRQVVEVDHVDFDEEEGEEPGEGPSQGRVDYFIQWNSSRRLLLTASAVDSFIDSIASHKDVAIQIGRTIRGEFEDKGWIDYNMERYKGQACCDLSQFLEPGCSRVEGSFLVGALTEADLLSALLGPSPPPSPEGRMRGKRAPAAGAAGGKKAAAAGKKGPKKGAEAAPPQMQAEDGVGPDSPNPYELAGSYVRVVFEFNKPLIPLPKDRPRPDIRVSDLIPPRPALPYVKEDPDIVFQKEITAVAKSLAEEYHAQFGDFQEETVDVNQKDFVFELNSSGKYFHFKERLKSSILRIAHETLNAPGLMQPSLEEDRDAFFNKLYVHLIKSMHVALNSLREKKQSLQEEVPEGYDSDLEARFLRWALEAERDENYLVAERYLKERISLNPRKSVMWYDYALFCLRAEDPGKAEEALRECLGLNLDDQLSLMACGAVLCEREQYMEAEVLLQSAVDASPVQPRMAWALLGLFLTVLQKDSEAKYAFNLAQQQPDEGPHKGKSMWLQLAHYLLPLNTAMLVKHALQMETTQHSKSCEVHVLYGRLYFQHEDHIRAEEHFQEASALNTLDADPWLYLGHCYYAQGRVDEACDAYNRALSVRNAPQDSLLHYHLGQLYIQKQQFELACDNYLLATKIWSCGIHWLGLGISYYHLKDFDRAEQALAEANVLDNQNGVVWGFLALVALVQGRHGDARRAFLEAMRLNLEDPYVFSMIAEEYLSQGSPDAAEEVMRSALRVSNRSSDRRMLADILRAQNKWEEALQQYEVLLETHENTEERKHALQQLFNILSSMDRDEDARRYAHMLEECD